MAWTSIVENGDQVATPHGTGQVRRISQAQGTAQVDVNGQLFEVPLNQVTKTDGEPTPQGEKMPDATPVSRYKVKKGDRVQNKAGSAKGTVSEVTQRSVKVKFDNGNRNTFPKSELHNLLDYAQEGDNPLKVGDRVKLEKSQGYSDHDRNLGKEGIVDKDAGNGAVHVTFDDGTASTIYKNTGGVTLEDALKKLEPEHKPETKEDEAKAEDPQAAKANDTVAQTGDGLYEIFKLKEHLENKIDTTVETELQELRELAKKHQKLEVKVGDKVSVVEGLKHKQLEQLIHYAALRLSPLLVGMAGTGKTHAGEQTAVALGLPFYSMSVGAQTSKSDIIGYMAANGQYVSTHFRKAYEEGGVFLMDEIDAGNANVLIQINAALSNGLCAFPDKMVKRHEDFVFIASANTFGNGANRQYVGRNQLDAATLDRFAVIEWFIDDELEAQLTTGLNGKAWYMAVRAARDYVADKNIRALISPRATQKGSKLLNVGQDLKEVIHATMLGSVPDDKKEDVTKVATTIFEKFASEVPGKLPREVDPVARVDDLLKEPAEAYPF
jgi:MoxR-like ATPase/preprotein translocase subunit YajC